ncbi:MAG: hypothetical protein QF473_01375 [Planctomycetota bacterium]|nr:hypothetical protein [Planctomycetota bacterium]
MLRLSEGMSMPRQWRISFVEGLADALVDRLETDADCELQLELMELLEREDDHSGLYAQKKTNLLVTENNRQGFSKDQLEEWDDAIQEYLDLKARMDAPNTPEFPIGTVAYYGPDDKVTTKIAAGVIEYEGAEVIVRRWGGSDVTTSPKVQKEIEEFFREYGVKNVGVSDGNLGCPHEEGMDYPSGEDCPFCPFWKGKREKM